MIKHIFPKKYHNNDFINSCNLVVDAGLNGFTYGENLNLSNEQFAERIDEERLFELIRDFGNKDRGDEDISKYKIKYENLVSREEIREHALDYFKFIGLIDKDQDICISGNGYYPRNCYMGWHTNRCQPGFRIYMNWASEDRRSGLAFYKEGVTNKVQYSFDRKGWNIRKFPTHADPEPFWHLVWSKCDRISLGFRVLED